MKENLQPIIILVRPQLGENIGATARAMLNCGLEKLRIVSPRDGWPNAKAIRNSSGAEKLIYNAGLFDSTLDAVSDLNYVIACTTRKRDLRKPQFGIEEALDELIIKNFQGNLCGILFGSESSGLMNDDLAFADLILSINTNKDFSSLNLSHAVLLVCYYWLEKIKKELNNYNKRKLRDMSDAATKSELSSFFNHLEKELKKGGFLYPPEKSPTMIKNLRSIFLRSSMNAQEVRTMRGVINALKRAGKLN